MSYQPILISNFETGLETDLKPWLLPNDAFPDLEDCYVFRGRVIRKQGVRKIGRLQLNDPNGGITLGTHSTKPQTFTNTFPTVPVAPGSVYISDGTITYHDDGQGNLVSQQPSLAITGVTLGPVSTIIIFASAPPFSVGDIVWVTGTIGVPGLNLMPLTVTAVSGILPFSITVTYNSMAQQPWEQDGIVNWYGGQINYFTGAFTVTFYNAATSTPVIANGAYYPGKPVMGLTQLQTPAINQESLIAFDTTNAYIFNNSTNQFNDISFSDTGNPATGITWSGSNSQFFWSVNYANAVFTTNFNTPDGIRYYAQADGGDLGWQQFAPPVLNDETVLTTCLMMFPYRGRLVCINTIETGDSGGTFPQRARWSQNGTPYYQDSANPYPPGPPPDVQTNPPAPFGYDVESWREDIQGKGGYADAPTREQALSGAFINDNLIVFFEKSTWLLRYTNDPNGPFVWERVDSDFGSESTFSTVTFSKGVFSIGNLGIITCDGNNLTRIDQRIPQDVFEIQNINQGPQRVQGIRNFKEQLVYWTFPNQSGGIFPNRVLVLNYIEASYAFFNDSFTCFGAYSPAADIQWQYLTSSWQGWDKTWANPTGDSFTPEVAAGNQQGYVLQLDSQDYPDPSLFVANIATTTVTTVTSPNHNLSVGQFIAFVNFVGTGNLTQFVGTSSVPVIFKVDGIVDVNNFTITGVNGNQFSNAYTYSGNGEIIVISNFLVQTKRFNLGIKEGRQTSIGYIDFYVDRDDYGQFTCDVYVGDDNSQPCNSITISTAAEPPSSLNNDRLWKRGYTRTIGTFYQLNLYLSDAQMFNKATAMTDFELHGLLMWLAKSGRLPY